MWAISYGSSTIAFNSTQDNLLKKKNDAYKCNILVKCNCFMYIFSHCTV